MKTKTLIDTTPYIPGSSVKGVVQHFARSSPFGQQHPEVCDELFGAEPGDTNPLGLSGLVLFHDAWWVPGSAPKPLEQEVVTTHHPEYYQTEGKADASDLDSPIPNAQIAVRGSFLFVLDGSLAWMDLAENILRAALENRGIGAKTRSGYGFLQLDEEGNAALSKVKDKMARETQERKQAEDQREAAAQRQIKIDGMSNEQRLVFEAGERVEAFLRLDEAIRKQKGSRETLNAALNKVLKAAPEWPDQQHRNAAAGLLEDAYDRTGWTDPGLKNSRQRERQKSKREAKIEEIRKGPGS